MAQDKTNSEEPVRLKENHPQKQSVGNQQGTTQTGAQNGGGENIDQEDDQYTEDLRNSGQRKSRDENAGS